MGHIKPMKDSSVSLLKQMVDNFEQLNSTYWPYALRVKTYDMFPAERFCYDNFKSRNWRNRGTKFAFKRKEDYEWFVLRWS